MFSKVSQGLARSASTAGTMALQGVAKTVTFVAVPSNTNVATFAGGAYIYAQKLAEVHVPGIIANMARNAGAASLGNSALAKLTIEATLVPAAVAAFKPVAVVGLAVAVAVTANIVGNSISAYVGSKSTSVPAQAVSTALDDDFVEVTATAESTVEEITDEFELLNVSTEANEVEFTDDEVD
jgi:hypothetical protein